MANTGLNLKQTKGTFEVSGKVSGVKSKKFYTEGTTTRGDSWRRINFAVEYNKNEKIYVSLFGMTKDSVYFSSKEKDENGKRITKKVDWKDRKTFTDDNFTLIGIHAGVKRTLNSEGKEINDKNVFTEYDACEYLAQNLKDGASVYIRGNISYREYNGNVQTTFEIANIFGSWNIDFDKEDFKPTHNFIQPICYESVRKNEDGTFSISGYIVGYNSLVGKEFITRNPKMAKNIKDRIKPYSSFSLFGDITSRVATEEIVEEDDGWGDTSYQKVNTPMVTEMIVNFVNGNDADDTIYSQESIETAIAKIAADKKAREEFSGNSNSTSTTTNNSSSNDDWGSAPSSSNNSDFDFDWN